MCWVEQRKAQDRGTFTCQIPGWPMERFTLSFNLLVGNIYAFIHDPSCEEVALTVFTCSITM